MHGAARSQSGRSSQQANKNKTRMFRIKKTAKIYDHRSYWHGLETRKFTTISELRLDGWCCMFAKQEQVDFTQLSMSAQYGIVQKPESFTTISELRLDGWCCMFAKQEQVDFTQLSMSEYSKKKLKFTMYLLLSSSGRTENACGLQTLNIMGS